MNSCSYSWTLVQRFLRSSVSAILFSQSNNSSLWVVPLMISVLHQFFAYISLFFSCFFFFFAVLIYRFYINCHLIITQLWMAWPSGEGSGWGTELRQSETWLGFIVSNIFSSNLLLPSSWELSSQLFLSSMIFFFFFERKYSIRRCYFLFLKNYELYNSYWRINKIFFIIRH